MGELPTVREMLELAVERMKALPLDPKYCSDIIAIATMVLSRALQPEVEALAEALEELLRETEGYNVAGVYFGEEREAKAALDKAAAALDAYRRKT
jgi:hypothetical protein